MVYIIKIFKLHIKLYTITCYRKSEIYVFKVQLEHKEAMQRTTSIDQYTSNRGIEESNLNSSELG